MSRRVATTVLAFVLAASTAALLVLEAQRRRTAHAALPHRTTAAARGLSADGRTPAEERAIADALKAFPSKGGAALRPASDADAKDSDSRRELETLYADYHPYFVRGDLNGDGHLDFAQAFVEKDRSAPWFHVAVFFGRPDGSFEPPVWVERAVSLGTGDLTVERSILMVSPDVAQDQTRRWRWDEEERRFVEVQEPADGDDGDDLDTGDDGRPRARI